MNFRIDVYHSSAIITVSNRLTNIISFISNTSKKVGE